MADRGHSQSAIARNPIHSYCCYFRYIKQYSTTPLKFQVMKSVQLSTTVIPKNKHTNMYTCLHAHLPSCMPAFTYTCFHVHLSSCTPVFTYTECWEKPSFLESINIRKMPKCKSFVQHFAFFCISSVVRHIPIQL